jgi:hypothetical protein
LAAELGRIQDGAEDRRYLTAAHGDTFRTKIPERATLQKRCYARMTIESGGRKKTGKIVPKGTCKMLWGS